MARRKNTAEAFEVLLRIAEEQEKARARESSESDRKDGGPAPGGAGLEGAVPAPRARPLPPGGTLLPRLTRREGAPGGGLAAPLGGRIGWREGRSLPVPEGADDPVSARRRARWVEHPAGGTAGYLAPHPREPVLAPVEPGDALASRPAPVRMLEARDPLPEPLGPRPRDPPFPADGPAGETGGSPELPGKVKPGAAGIPAGAGGGGASGPPPPAASPRGEDGAGGAGAEGKARAVAPGADAAPPGASSEGSPGSGAAAGRRGRLRRVPERFLGLLLGDELGQALGRPVEVRVSTLLVLALALTVVLAVMAVYFTLPPRGDPLLGTLPEEPPGADSLASGGPTAPAGTAGWSAGTLPPMPPPLWRSGAAAAPPGGPLPEFRNLEDSPAPGGEQGPLPPREPERELWIRVRSLMYRGECMRVVEHLDGLREYLQRSTDCARAPGSVACGRVRAVAMDRKGPEGDLYAVEVGPYARPAEARAAREELRTLTKTAPWVFEEKPLYFDRAYIPGL